MPSANSPQTPPRHTKRSAIRRLAKALVLCAIIPMPAHPEPQHSDLGPDREDLQTYLECVVASNEGLLGFGEAAFCSTVFMKIKLSFLPDMTLDKYNSLPSLEKSEVNRLGYGRYLDWKQRNAAEVEALMGKIRASQADS